jgi:hypothetical protein
MPSTDPDVESEIATFLERLSAAQQELLSLLAAKRELIVRRDHASLASLAEREQRLGDELRACHAERQRLLAAADDGGRRPKSLADLTAALPGTAGKHLSGSVAAARQRSELIRHECLTQWVAVQRTVLHLAQMLEIIATGGRSQPTYGKSGGRERSGAIIDQAA